MLAASRTGARALSARRGFATVVDAAGVKVATHDAGQPTASVTLLAKAGSRYASQPGVAHALKNFAFKSTAKRSALGTIRETELYGGVLSTSLTREHLAITAEFLKGDEEFFVDLLTSFATSAKFSRYEFQESVLPTVQGESLAASQDPAVAALEHAHAVAFRSGLGSGLFAPDHPHFSEKEVAAFAAQVLAKDKVAFLGTGIDAGLLSKLVEAGFKGASGSASGASAATTTKYFGGEARAPSNSGPQTIFIGYGQAGASTGALAALAAHLNPTPAVKWSKGASSFAAALPNGTSAQSVLLPYSDGTLFGLLVQGATPGLAKDAAKAAVQALRSAGSLKSEEAKAAIAKAKFAAASLVDGREGLVAALGSKVLAGSDASLSSVTADLDKVDASAVSSTAQSLLKGKPTYVVVGDVTELPYADEVGL